MARSTFFGARFFGVSSEARAHAASSGAPCRSKSSASCSHVQPRSSRTDSAYCSDLCSQRSHGGLRNRYRKSEVHRELLARDGNRCGICSQRIDMRREWPHPRSASVDHLIPVSVGGSDELANLRLVHLSCNCARRAAMLDEQLAIV